MVVIFFAVPMYTKTRNGNSVLILGGYRYNQNNKYRGPRKRWQCTKATSYKCKASIVTYEEEIFRVNGCHNH